MPSDLFTWAFCLAPSDSVVEPSSTLASIASSIALKVCSLAISSKIALDALADVPLAFLILPLESKPKTE